MFRYLKGIRDYIFCYQASDLCLVGYSDDDWGGDLDQCKSTSGYAFLLSNSAISWSSKKQPCIALSTIESEYVACSTVVKEGVWLKRFIIELGIITRASEPITIHCDIMVALSYAKDPKYYDKTKHIDIRYHFIRDMVAQKKVVLKHITTSHMIADHLAKPIA